MVTRNPSSSPDEPVPDYTLTVAEPADPALPDPGGGHAALDRFWQACDGFRAETDCPLWGIRTGLPVRIGFAGLGRNCNGGAVSRFRAALARPP